MATTVWIRRKVNICELCGCVMGVGEAYALEKIDGNDVCCLCADQAGKV